MLRLDSYTEWSPSGNGVKVWLRGKLPEDARHRTGKTAWNGEFEVYDSARFFAVTGTHLRGSPLTIESRQSELDEVYGRIFQPARILEPVISPPPHGAAQKRLGDDELLERARSARNGERFERLWRGDTSDYNSRSEADAALCALLGFWTGGEAAQVDRLFRRSGLFREKWDSKRGASSYGAETIGNTLAVVREHYSGNGAQPSAEVELALLTARELCALPDPPESEQLLGPLLLRGQRLVLGAHTGEGKTSMALQIVRALVAEEEFLDWRGAGGRVLVLDAEQGLRTVKRRLREAGLDERDDVDYVRVPDGLALDSDEQHVAEVERALEQGNYVLVVADPLYKLHTGDSNDEREAVDLMRRFDGWRERFGFALLLPVHCRKPVPGMKFSIHDLFGSSAYVRGAEVVLGLRRVSDGYAKLHFLKDRDGDLPIGGAWGLLFDQEEGFRRDPNDGVVRDLQGELLETLADGEWRTLNKLRKPKDAGGVGANPDKLKPELEAMTDEGLLEFELGPEGERKDAKCWRLKRLGAVEDT